MFDVFMEKRGDRYYIGLSDGEVNKTIFYSDTYNPAEDCANELRKWMDDLRRRRCPWNLQGEIPRIR